MVVQYNHLGALSAAQAQKMWVDNTGKTFTFSVGNFFFKAMITRAYLIIAPSRPFKGKMMIVGH